MGIKSTYYITRKTALAIMFSRLQAIDNESLADMLEDFPESNLRSYRIVSWKEIEQNDKAEHPIPTIKSINQF